MASKCTLRQTNRIYSPSSSSDEFPDNDDAYEDTSSSSEDEARDTLIENLRMENRNLRQNNTALDTLAKETLERMVNLDRDHQDTVKKLTARHLDHTTTLKRKHAQLSQEYVQRIEDLEDENETLHSENSALMAKWNGAFDRHAELLKVQEQLKQANKDWEEEHREKLKAMDELEVAKKRAWTWEMMFKFHGEMPSE